ncbi:hypothetical protein EV182_000405 [Spiromyces aspiralis]|uniref:Uncharacterized protein n=1 Tax=Spiromyces aspiralis TaxID=68401 RepID=A0ACC1HJD3_9FUNG|nr:hypothetical protein EV182_000405 [Spiromyces aspiralis]
MAATTASYPGKEYLLAQAKDLIKFINASPSPFHAVDTVRNMLKAAKFEKLSEREDWSGKLKPNGRYYFTRNESTIVAFAVGGKYKPGNGVSIVAAHTDSPCLKVKPISKKSKEKYLQVGVQLYGGGIWHTWFDRDLGVAGRVVVKKKDGGFGHHLIRIDEPILRIPTLAIHLDRGTSNNFTFNNETQLLPILATASKVLNGNDLTKAKDYSNNIDPPHHPVFIERLASELGVKPESIGDFELCLYDVHPSVLGGIANEFIFSSRLDNLCMSYCAVEGFLASLGSSTRCPLSDEEGIRMISLFDNEEIGSRSAYGADSALMEYMLRRIHADGKPAAFEESVAKSFLVSADMAHAVHPNYSDKHEANHRPYLHKGTVIKFDANQRYATTAVTSALLKEVARIENVPLQEFVVRNDTSCGSTIGPLLSSRLGLRTIDIGNPQLSMHSIRETAGSDDVGHAVTLLKCFFERFTELDAQLSID